MRKIDVVNVSDMLGSDISRRLFQRWVELQSADLWDKMCERAEQKARELGVKILAYAPSAGPDSPMAITLSFDQITIKGIGGCRSASELDSEVPDYVNAHWKFDGNTVLLCSSKHWLPNVKVLSTTYHPEINTYVHKLHDSLVKMFEDEEAKLRKGVNQLSEQDFIDWLKGHNVIALLISPVGPKCVCYITATDGAETIVHGDVLSCD
jgi:hypothetical protein